MNMSFLKDFGDFVKKGTETISEEIKKRQELSQTKKRILGRFEMNDLKKISKDYGVGEPSSYEEDLYGEKSRRVVTREHYIDRIMDILTLDQIKNFADKNRIKIQDLLKEEKSSVNIEYKEEKNFDTAQQEPKVTTIEVKRQGEFDTILEYIEEQFEPEDVRDENDFEKQLTIFLKSKYPDRIKRQVETSKGKIDIVIDNKYAIELKIADSKGKLRDLVGQALWYKKEFDNVAIILLDVSKLPRSQIKEYIDEYEKQGVKTKVLDGILKKRKSKGKQINLRL